MGGLDRPTRSTQPIARNSVPITQSGERYRVNRPLGRGGMAFVYDATEIATGRRVALKRLQSHGDANTDLRNAELFEREYHTLSQLAHPRIVAVYDYGIDEAGPFYTMEMLDGGDLQQLAPLDWRTACVIARDVCSALSLVHSRRLVHRDVSPRNVRRTQDGLAKLIDFGAMAPMGPSKLVIGTPPCCAPESVSLQALDGRTDLFALGATLYFMLVGRHAYAARQFSMLNDAWRAGFAPPSASVPEIPPALDALVFDLLRPEPDARPANAAEVIQRLCAIDGQAPDEQLGVAAAYLTRPTLVGRELSLVRVKRRLERPRLAEGFSTIIEAGQGGGRSRFLDACVLEATLRGAIALRADAHDAATSGDYGVVRALTRQLLTIMPTTALSAAESQLAVLQQFIPELAAVGQLAPSAGPAATRSQFVAAVHAWLRALARSQPLILAIDDLHRIDESSTALLALLAHDGAPGIGCLFTVEANSPWTSAQSQQLLAESAQRIRLENLSREDSDSLLQSLFGEMPNIGVLVHRLHEVSRGNPRDLLRLAQHLVDRRVIRYEAGAWSFTTPLDASDLPNSMTQALQARIEALSATGRELATALALCADQAFTFDECAVLCEPPTAAALHADLDQLVRDDIVRWIEDRFVLAHAHWAPLLRAGLKTDGERRLHLRLAWVFEGRNNAFRAARHFLFAAEYARGLDVLVAHAAESQEQTARGGSEALGRYARSLPSDWMDTYDLALRQCDALGRSKRDAFVMRGRVSGLIPAFGCDDRGHVAVLLAELVRYCGLADWQELESAGLEPSVRVKCALQRAEERYEATPAEARVIAPAPALHILTRAWSGTLTNIMSGLDASYLDRLPAIAPFAEVLPSVKVTSLMASGVQARYSGRVERARVTYLDVLARYESPDRGGLDPSYAQLGRMNMLNGLAMMDACLGRASSVEWCAKTAASPLHRVHAMHSSMLYHLFQGDADSAEFCRKQAERASLESLTLYQSAYAFWEMTAHILTEDLTRMRHSLEQAATLAKRYEGWLAMHHFIAAEYDRVRRDSGRALQRIQQALAHAKPGVHPVWASMACTHVRCLFDLSRFDEALRTAERYAAVAREYEIEHEARQLVLALAVCKAQAGQSDAAALADSVVAELTAQQCQGLHLGLAHEARARVAQLLHDEDGFAQHAEACREVYCKYKNPALLAKYKRLCQTGQRGQAALSGQFDTPDSYGAYTGTRIVAALEFCKNLEQRAHLALTLLARHSGATGGVLFTLGMEGLESIGEVGGVVLAQEVETRVKAYFDQKLAEGGDVTATHSAASDEVESSIWVDFRGQAYRPVLLSHTVEGRAAMIGIAALAVSQTQTFRHPVHVASAISRFWADQGYTSVLMMED